MSVSTTPIPQDDYLSEINDRLHKSKIYLLFAERCNFTNDPAGPDALSLVNQAVHYAYQRHKLVLRHMGEFTLHDAEHLFRLLHLMEQLIPEENLLQLSNPELMLLILSVFFHDIGMAPSERDVKCWLGLVEGEPSMDEILEQEQFLRFVSGRETDKLKVDVLRKESKFAEADYLMRYLVSEYIRITHANRAVDVIKNDWNGKIRYREMDLTPQLASLCRSHNQEATTLLDMEHLVPVGQGCYICLPFLGCILRLADILDFDTKRTPTVLYKQLFIKDPTSIKEWEKHRAVKNWTITPAYINFSAECSHPTIQHSILHFCKLIDLELMSCTTILNNLHSNSVTQFPPYYRIPLPAKVDTTHIKPVVDLYGKSIYLYKESSFKLNSRQIIELLMGTKLYGQPNVAIRELLQNSIDTCLLREKLETQWGNSYRPQITISFIKQDTGMCLIVEDNGCGMDQDIIDRFYSNIGSSYYKSTDFLEMKSILDTTFTPISRFGIGVLSYFMVSNSIEIETRRVYSNYNYSNPLFINIEGDESIFYIKPGKRQIPGTITTLRLHLDNPWENMSPAEITSYIKETIPYPPFKIEIQIGEYSITHTPPTLNDIRLDNFKIYYNDPNPNIKSYLITFDGTKGIFGKGELMLLEEDGVPKKSIDFTSEQIEIQDQKITFKSTVKMADNNIVYNYDELNTRELDGKIKLRPAQTHLREARSKIALHGIELPVSLFSQWSGSTYQQAKIHWPICIYLNININQLLDINLTSARNEILTDEKWTKFESILAELILQQIKEQVTTPYWTAFVDSLTQEPFDKNVVFPETLKKVCLS